MQQNINLGDFITKEACLLPKDVLTTHAAVLGMTGSGKTGLLLGMVEELVRQRVPLVLVDNKGDMINLALSSPLADKMAVRCLTPGADHGESIDVFADLEVPEKSQSVVTAMLKMVGEDHDPIKSRAHSYLSTILNKRHAKKKPCTLLKIIHAVQTPSFHHLGAMDIDYAFPKRARTKLAGKLNNLLVAPSFQSWREGVPLRMTELLAPRADNRVPVVVYSVAHLVDQDEQAFALQLLLEELLPWMRKSGGSNTLKAALVIDECVGLMPPHPRNPPTKTPLLMLLKQARAFGLGLILASQNPVDLDYKGLANCQTWMIGRLQMGKDKARVIHNICSASPRTVYDMEQMIGKLHPRQFLLVRPSGTRVFSTRQVGCNLKGPLTPDEIVAMYLNSELAKPEPKGILNSLRKLTVLRGGA